MLPGHQINQPILFNPLKHHLGYIREFIALNADGNSTPDNEAVVRELKHIGGSVMDVYCGNLSYDEIGDELLCYITTKKLKDQDIFHGWAGTGAKDFRTIYLSDGSNWVMKYYDNEQRFVHSFPARFSPNSFRIKANTLKSAILYQIFIGKDFVSEEDLNTARAIAGLSPVREIFDTEAIAEMIEMLRG
ncbi:MAG TPA: hypothetical protein VMT63_01005 [Bacteroidales bacterium]|nr:hypothetical protein [Bacteroidales bacterium]